MMHCNPPIEFGHSPKERGMGVMEECLDRPLAKVLEVIQKRILTETTYFGIRTLQSPMDFWIYQEIIYEIKPDLIVEIGNHQGGSTLALAHLLDLMGSGRVVGVDIDHRLLAPLAQNHPRIQFVTGDACAVFDEVKQLVRENEKVLVIEDSAHTYENTLKVLRTYCELVPVGSYFIVEDSICHHGLDEGPHPGPFEAIEAFVNESNDFEIDRSRETFGITWNPKGYLKRIR